MSKRKKRNKSSSKQIKDSKTIDKTYDNQSQLRVLEPLEQVPGLSSSLVVSRLSLNDHSCSWKEQFDRATQLMVHLAAWELSTTSHRLHHQDKF